jgi:hypothetical protein
MTYYISKIVHQPFEERTGNPALRSRAEEILHLLVTALSQVGR